MIINAVWHAPLQVGCRTSGGCSLPFCGCLWTCCGLGSPWSTHWIRLALHRLNSTMYDRSHEQSFIAADNSPTTCGSHSEGFVLQLVASFLDLLVLVLLRRLACLPDCCIPAIFHPAVPYSDGTLPSMTRSYTDKALNRTKSSRAYNQVRPIAFLRPEEGTERIDSLISPSTAILTAQPFGVFTDKAPLSDFC